MAPSRSSGSFRHGARTPHDSPASVPLWREAIRIESELRPAVAQQEAARDESVPYVWIAASTMVTGGVAVVGGVFLYREGLVRARLDRPPKLQGNPIVPLPQLLRPPIVKAAWKLGAATFAGGVVLWLLVFALPLTRRVALRWSIIPLALGVLAALYGQWWVANAF